MNSESLVANSYSEVRRVAVNIKLAAFPPPWSVEENDA
jgi:hypothetical protein